MTKMTLYTGGGVSYSPQYADGRTESDYVRLVADDGKGITDGVNIVTVIDTNDPERWTNCELPEDAEETKEEST